MAVAAIILAAGESRRLATPKQLLLYQGTTLIARSVAAATGSRCDRTIVVLGANADAIADEIGGLQIGIVRNPDWRDGKSTTIKAGIRALSDSPTVYDAAILMTCDQPHVDSALLNGLIDHHHVLPNAIVACEYAGTVGVPALLPREYFDELMQLAGDEGAKRVFVAHPDRIQTIPFPEGAFDIDTPQDLDNM